MTKTVVADCAFRRGDRVRLTADAIGVLYPKEYTAWRRAAVGRMGTVDRQPRRKAVRIYVRWDGNKKGDYLATRFLEVVPPLGEHGPSSTETRHE